MVVIEGMTMPSCCMNCELLGKEEMYCSIYPRRDLDIITVTTNRPNWCPLVEKDEHKIEKLEKIKHIVDRQPTGFSAEEKAYNYMMQITDIKEILE